jgi:choline-sulfatase
LLISGPGIPAGKRVDELVYQHSMYATTCELAGVPVPETVEFPSLVPLLRGESGPLHDAVFSRYRDFQRAVRTKTHKLIVYPQVRRVQLFDLEHDPWEINDLSSDPASAAIRTALYQRLRQFQSELGDTLDLEHPAPEMDETSGGTPA